MISVDDATAVGQLLHQVLEPPTAQQATEKIKELMKNVKFINSLVIQMAQNPDTGIRQLAAVLLRRRLAKSWCSVTMEMKNEIKKTLLNRLVNDPIHIIRLSIAHIVSSLGKLILMEWKFELFEFLQNCSQSQQESHREIAQVVFSSILDSNAESLRPLFEDFAKVFQKGLQDPTSASVRLAAMRGVSALACNAETKSDFIRLRQLIPAMVSVTREACEGNKEDTVVFALELFDDLAESSDAIKKEDLPDMIRFMLVIGGNSKLSIGVREQAFNFIHSVGKQKPQVITKNNLVPNILDVAIPMAIQPDPSELDEDELTPHRIAAQCIDSLSLNLPSRWVFEPVVRYLAPLMTSSNQWEKRGALILIGIMSEGCEDIMRLKLNELLPPVLQSFSDSNPMVKSAAAVCLGQMAEYLQPEITQSHEMTIQVLLNAMVDPATTTDEKVQEKLCYAVELFVENLEEFEIESHLPNLMRALLHGLTTAKGNRARENCVGAIGSVAQASKAKFTPYVEQVFHILQEALIQTSDELIPLRARAVQIAGSIVQGMPMETTSMYQEKLVELVFNGLETIDHYDLRESSYRFFGCLAYTLKDRFAPIIPKIMPYVFATLMNTDGIVTQYEEEDEDPLEGVDSEEDEEDERRIKGIHIRTGFIDEQEAAIDFLCCLYRNVSGKHMSVWLKQTLDCIESLHRYFNYGVRQCVPNLMQALLINVHHTFLPPWAPHAESDSPTNLGKNVSTETPDSCANMTTSENRGWIPGLPCQSLLHEHTLQLWVEKLWPIFHQMLDEDDSKEVICDVCNVIGELLELLGPHLLQGTTIKGVDVQTSLIQNAIKLFSGKHECQKFEEGEIDNDEDSRALEVSLFEGLSTLISGLAQTMGDQFQVPFLQLHPKMLRLAVHRKSSGYRGIIGCYGDIFRTMGAAAIPFVEPVIEPSLEGVCQSEDFNLKRNAAFCLGTICELAASLPAVQNQFLKILKALHPIISANTENMREAELYARDNAVAALGRMLRSCAVDQIPQAEVVPLFLHSLPLKVDFEESEGILKTLLHLCHGGCNKSILEQYQSEFLKAIVGELVNGSLTKTTKEQAKSILLNAIQTLGLNHPTITTITQSHPKYQNLLTKLMK